ncbi:PREDICTED: ankyrin repeat domain-containing protein 40-like [Cyphomyrmex costatus]|uniref:Ankyrin repeat domain-containing protein 40 n=1 Tax=Cyphomyrmex costatus TaxID=456900 RepID=A0A195CU72_9HYME|nr:PREDICTED: ankyrin repeat domain-containing protein 40-like [Cyphomyrmex costatus]KYN04077.1 Ankyrin repeat domain-containing protein 40 [Cyphomyrmex costatus]
MERMLEERLRERVCLDDTEAVQDLLTLGVEVNAREPVSGWTALHWACKQGYLDIVVLLLKNGADKNIRSEIGETPASVCSNQQILYLLDTSDDLERIMYDTSLRAAPSAYAPSDFLRAPANSSKARNNIYDKNRLTSSFQDELVLKIRIANTADSDFIEVELPRSELTYQALLCLCCKELDLNLHQIQKLRKLPNTRLRRDKDIQRLQNFQEIEVVIDATNMYKSIQNANGVANSLPTLPANGYQSICKKDQTILY